MSARLGLWLKAFWRWLAEARLFWCAILVLVLAVVWSFRSDATDLQVRVAGLVLQWLGIGTVAHGVRETRKLFGRPGLPESVRQWRSRFPRWRQDVFVGMGGGAIGSAGGGGRAHVSSRVDPAAPVQVQLDALKENTERMDQELIQMQREMDGLRHQHSEALRQERELRGKGDEELHLRLEAAETGGLNITFVGVLWLFVGVLLATLSPEIARWF